jgi:acetyltransferase-like isoleucine patch superfamily enzyme
VPRPVSPFKSHGTGRVDHAQFAAIGSNVVLEPGVLIFHPEVVHLGSNIYVGHNTILKGYFRNSLTIGDDTWIGQQCFFHSAGGLRIGNRVGIGPSVKIITSRHKEEGRTVPILYSDLELAAVLIEDDCDVGVGAIILPGVRIGRGSQIGAGAVVTADVEPFSVVAGVPARLLRSRIDADADPL